MSKRNLIPKRNQTAAGPVESRDLGSSEIVNVDQSPDAEHVAEADAVNTPDDTGPADIADPADEADDGDVAGGDDIPETNESRDDALRRLSNELASRLDGCTADAWGLFRRFPKSPTSSTLSVSSRPPAVSDGEKTGIVMQGPVIDEDELTLGTLRLYRQTMPAAVPILSTWRGLSDENRDRIEALGVNIVESDPPKCRGPQNLNLQIASTAQGMRYAQSLGCTHVLKTRTDTRVHASDADQFCRGLLMQFPIAEDAGQVERIAVLDFATRLFMPYHPSDIMMFGHIDDMLRYWNPELYGEKVTSGHETQFGRLVRQPLPEMMLCKRFLRSTGTTLLGTVAHWWQILAQRFVVVDRTSMDHFWIKEYGSGYHPNQAQWDRTNMAICHFPQWLQMHLGCAEPAVDLEDLAQQQMFDFVHEGNCRPREEQVAAANA
ncbi:MAG: hypothetical protein F9B45_21815 [Phycisphaera sp. RhM]|nr:hypothetical protein [Phycisphaera sp. RhM]